MPISKFQARISGSPSIRLPTQSLRIGFQTHARRWPSSLTSPSGVSDPPVVVFWHGVLSHFGNTPPNWHEFAIRPEHPCTTLEVSHSTVGIRLILRVFMRR